MGWRSVPRAARLAARNLLETSPCTYSEGHRDTHQLSTRSTVLLGMRVSQLAGCARRIPPASASLRPSDDPAGRRAPRATPRPGAGVAPQDAIAAGNAGDLHAPGQLGPPGARARARAQAMSGALNDDDRRRSRPSWPRSGTLDGAPTSDRRQLRLRRDRLRDAPFGGRARPQYRERPGTSRSASETTPSSPSARSATGSTRAPRPGPCALTA